MTCEKYLVWQAIFFFYFEPWVQVTNFPPRMRCCLFKHGLAFFTMHKLVIFFIGYLFFSNSKVQSTPGNHAKHAGHINTPNNNLCSSVVKEIILNHTNLLASLLSLFILTSPIYNQGTKYIKMLTIQTAICLFTQEI